MFKFLIILFLTVLPPSSSNADDRTMPSPTNRPQSEPDKIVILKAMAEKGDPDAQYGLGKIYLNVNKSEAIKWLNMAADHYRRAAEKGDADAQYRLGDMLQHGLIEGGEDLAARWYYRAGKQGNAEAMALALRLDPTLVHGEHQTRAEKIQGFADGVFERVFPRDMGVYRPTATMPSLSLVTQPSVRLQVSLKQAEEGNADAQFALGVYYSCRNLITASDTDEAAALTWLRRAAEQGNWRAQVALGALLYDGGSEVFDATSRQYKFRGIHPDDAEAYFWSAVALKSGHLSEERESDRVSYIEAAERGRKNAAIHLTSDQAAAAQKRADEWKAIPHSGSSTDTATSPAPDWITAEGGCSSQ